MKTNQTPATTRRVSVRRSVPYALLALAGTLTVAATWYVSVTTDARQRAAILADHERFLTESERTRRQLEDRLNTYIEIIHAGAALLAASNEISPVEFRAFVAGLQLADRYPGMQAIGFAQRVAATDLSRFRRNAYLDGITRLRDWQLREKKPEYFPVIFLEPRDRPIRDGHTFDLSSDPALQAAMDRARETRRPAASGEVGKNVVLVFVPVYRLRTSRDTIEERREALLGFVFSPFDVEDLLDQIATGTGSVAFEVHDGPVASAASLLGDPIGVPRDGRYESVQSLRVAGREWMMVARPSKATVITRSSSAQWTLIGGVLLSLLLFSVSYAQVRAWETVARHEAGLRTSEQALRESEAQAQAAGRAKDEFLATLSHELRTPLNAILGWVSMLRNGSLREERRAHALAVIERNAQVQADLIEDLLDISRIITGKVRLRLRPTLVMPIVSGAVESLRPGAEAKGVRLHVRATSDAIMIRADAERVQQIVWNLVSNAIKFTPAHGHVAVELEADAICARLIVRDTGIGITPEFLPYVFERFRQADSSPTRSHRGLGLGLSIVKHLVELHGGSIVARSAGINRGAQFITTFPIATAAEESNVPLVVRESLPAAVLDGVRVLVVDDDQSTRELLSEALSATGAHVTVAASASDALTVLTTSGADAIVSDIAMPEEDGFSLMRRVRSLRGDIARIPAIALTAFARADDRQRAMEAGFQMHLAKPVELSELQTELAQLISLRSG